MRTLDSQDLEDIVYGACLLGCGGGGPFSTARDMLKAILDLTDKITVLDATEADAEDTFVVTAYIGSATAASHTAFKHLAPPMPARDWSRRSTGLWQVCFRQKSAQSIASRQ